MSSFLRSRLYSLTVYVLVLVILVTLAFFNLPAIFDFHAETAASPVPIRPETAASPVPIRPHSLIIYPHVPSAAASSVYSVTANGQPVFVEHYNSLSFVRFGFTGQVDIRVTVNQSIHTYSLSPENYGIQTTLNNNAISFSLTLPRKLMLWDVNAIPEKLLIFADPEEEVDSHIGDSIVKSIMDYAVVDTGQGDMTAKLQHAIDETSANRQVLYISDGLYMFTHLMMRTNTNIYLSSGAVLRVIPGSVENEAIDFTSTSNARIGGHGILDGGMSADHVIVTKDSRDFIIEGLTILASQGTIIRFQNSTYGAVENSNILADPSDLADGIDIDSSQNIRINNVFIHSTDDNIALGQTQVAAVQTIENIKINNSVLYNKISGANIKISPWMVDATGYFVRNMFVGNDYMISGANYTLAVYAVAGLSVDDIRFSNIWYEQTPDKIFEFHIEEPFWDGVPWSGRYGTISNVYIDNFHVAGYGSQNSSFMGHSAVAEISGVYFNHFTIDEIPILDVASAHFDLNQYVQNMQFANSPGNLK